MGEDEDEEEEGEELRRHRAGRGAKEKEGEGDESWRRRRSPCTACGKPLFSQILWFLSSFYFLSLSLFAGASPSFLVSCSLPSPWRESIRFFCFSPSCKIPAPRPHVARSPQFPSLFRFSVVGCNASEEVWCFLFVVGEETCAVLAHVSCRPSVQKKTVEKTHGDFSPCGVRTQHEDHEHQASCVHSRLLIDGKVSFRKRTVGLGLRFFGLISLHVYSGAGRAGLTQWRARSVRFGSTPSRLSALLCFLCVCTFIPQRFEGAKPLRRRAACVSIYLTTTAFYYC